MIEKTADEARCIERYELMHHSRRHPLFGQCRRGARSRCHQDGELACAKLFDQGNDRKQLADTRAMHPYQRTARALDLRLAPTLGPTLRMLLAAPKPAQDQKPSKRGRHRGQYAIDPKRDGQRVKHALPPIPADPSERMRVP